MAGTTYTREKTLKITLFPLFRKYGVRYNKAVKGSNIEKFE